MTPVIMNSHVFDNVGPYQYVAPTLTWLAGRNDFRIIDLQVIFNLDFNRGEYRIQINCTRTASLLCDYTEQLACAKTGEQKNIDDVMSMVKLAVGGDRYCQVQTAANQFQQWFDRKVSEWLKHESERDRLERSPQTRERCEDLVYGIEVLK